MKNPTPKQIALLTAGLLSLGIFVLLLILKRVDTESLGWEAVIALPLLLFVFAYFSFYYALGKFIYRKIKVIYKVIYEHKTSKGDEGDIQFHDHAIEEAEQEVIRWADKKREEIEQLKKMEAYRREFLGNVSHELKTPVFNIQGYIETLIDGGLEDEKINVEYLHKAARNVNRLSLIIKDLEEISSSESERMNIKLETFVIADLVQEVADSLEMQADVADVTIRFKPGCDLTYQVEADKERIGRVLTNLLTNSIKYGKEHGETLIGCYDMDQNILIEISDNGIGIEKEHIPRLFERFYRVDSSRSREQGGTGLGLSIVKHIIEAHNQTINVRSTVGVGSTFGFTLKKV